MYHDYFGLTQAPFRMTPDTGFFFAGGNRGAILDALCYAIGQGEGVIKVTGEVGSGKTMLCRMLQARLPETIDIVYIANPSVPPEEVLRAICAELQLELPPAAGRHAAQQRLAAYLLEQHAAGRQVVVFVEESQSMPLATLEEIRLLSNLETARHKLLQIVLFGQPELDEILRRPDMRPLRERITHSFTLGPLTQAEVAAYLAFRLRAAGYRGPDLFGPRLARRIARVSQGLTRRINLIADKTLLAAYAEGTHTLAIRHVRAAIGDSEFAAGPAAGLAGRRWLAVAGLAALAGGAVVYGWMTLVDRSPAAAGERAHTVARAADASPRESPPAGGATDRTAAGPAQQPVPAVERDPVDAARTAPAPPAPPAAAGPASLLAQRIAAGQRWLQESPPETLAIQVLGTADGDEIERRLTQLARSVESEKLFVFRTVARDRPSLTIVYGGFDDRVAARAALERLPAPIRANNPLLRTVRGLREELAAVRG
jgi:type II secretory pathway predicted ATPase ExeA